MNKKIIYQAAMKNLNYLENIYKKENFKGRLKGGLKSSDVKKMRIKYGNNILTQKKRVTLLSAILKALFEPMIIILLVALTITVGINIGNLSAGRPSDFFESIGILCAITISVGLTVFMEHKSEKAFEMLQKFAGAICVSVLRDGEKKVINYGEVVVGDIIFLEAGDKIIADGVILKCDDLECEESTLSGEARTIYKKAYENGNFTSDNVLYSGTYVKSGNCVMLALAVGDNAEIGKIAGGLKEENQISAPLAHKLNKLSQKISLFGAIAALIVFILTLSRLAFSSDLNFENVREAFMQAMVLIVAAVPEGLPSTVAISLALSVVKLAKSNAVIKKLIAAETVGCVSVICSDKTGTLTFGKMQVNRFVRDGKEISPLSIKNGHIYNNIVYNSTASFVVEKDRVKPFGNTTEQALITAVVGEDYKKLSSLRANAPITSRKPFSSENKYMTTEVFIENNKIFYVKGSIEKVVAMCRLTAEERNKILNGSSFYAQKAERIIAFAHGISAENLTFDGYCCISDRLRDDVFKAVKECRQAGIDVKILTGDNRETAVAIATKLCLAHSDKNILTGGETENMSDERLKNLLPEISVIARSTPETKLRVVKLLKELGEVVAVTGDGVNDAPAVKNADIGISMGDGSEITKEASDIILLDNSFSQIVKAVSFGRNIYRNFQRFLFFQLTVNFSAVALILFCLMLGFEAPFNTLQLLWINVIMDGPLALTLALERRDEHLMDEKPVRRTDAIVTKKMFLRIFLHSFFIVGIIILQKLYNFLGVTALQSDTAIFSMFVIFQLFNGINARETGCQSILKSVGGNHAFNILLVVTLIMQFFITEYLCNMFLTMPLGFAMWIKIAFICLSIVLLSEIYKFIYRRAKKTKVLKKIIKRSEFA